MRVGIPGLFVNERGVIATDKAIQQTVCFRDRHNTLLLANLVDLCGEIGQQSQAAIVLLYLYQCVVKPVIIVVQFA